jgi:2-C-methyl-D-erythritol 4-phosphate cytidylyltransferase
MEFTAIIPAGGKGQRSGLTVPKQFHKIGGKELISYTIEIFQKNRNIKNILVSAPEEYFPLLEHCKRKYGFTKVRSIVKGGKERQDSVYNALLGWKFSTDDYVVVHDAARPLLAGNTLNKVLQHAKYHGNAVLAMPARDTLAEANGFIMSYSERNRMYYIQTPQVFRYTDLINAFEKAYADNFYGTDESMLVHRTGIKVNLVEGSYLNFKITTPEDILLFKKIIRKK